MMLQMQHIKTEGQHECSIKGDCAAFTDHRRTKKTEHHIQLSGSNTERNQNAAPRSRREARRKEKHKMAGIPNTHTMEKASSNQSACFWLYDRKLTRDKVENLKTPFEALLLSSAPTW